MAQPTREAAEHVPARPSWDCRVCLNPWPCAPAKVALLEEFGTFRTVLLIYLSAQMWEAVGDMLAQGQPWPSADCYERFISWARCRR